MHQVRVFVQIIMTIFVIDIRLYRTGVHGAVCSRPYLLFYEDRK